MKWFFGAVLVVLVLLVLAIANAPASLIPLALSEAQSRGMMQPGAPVVILSNTSGTVWKGQAMDAVIEIDDAKLELGVVSWQLSAMSLLQKKPVITISSMAPGQNIQTSITITEQGEITVDDLEGRLPISVLEPWLPMLVKGEMAFVIDHIRFNARQLLALDGVLNLEYVDWIGGEYDMPLGSYMAQISLQENNIIVLINDFSANLGIDGLLSVNAGNGAYQFTATLDPREDLAPEVAETIVWLGKRSSNGDVVINKRGRF